MIDLITQSAPLGERIVSCGYARDCPCAILPYHTFYEMEEEFFCERCRSKIQQEELKGI